ncbi:MAG TPA: 4-hydroxy-tetrahydrodipicolinate synthase [Ruminococcaceae bacterium]|nr:4-hydroxy-tetrahydrodipicolinate synthase [Oscillospiraceae bacterium]
MSNSIFTGCATAIATPMNSDGSINYDEFGRLIDWQIDNKIDALVICGTTGESATMTDDEHVEVLRYGINRVAKRVPVIAGAGSNDTKYAVDLSVEAEKLGADALLHVTPYYNKASQRGLIKHFTAIADAVNIPIMLYNVPSRTGCNISLDTYVELAKHPNIRAVKEASANMKTVMGISANTDLDIYSGNDDEALCCLALGGKGLVSVTSNVAPLQKHNEIACYLEGRREEALEIAKKLFALDMAMFMDVNPIPVKEALNLAGFKAGECRLPLCSMSDEMKSKLKSVMEENGLLNIV